jgi:6-phosphofructo-2-kinase / fructose-2,6-biphosphatase 4
MVAPLYTTASGLLFHAGRILVVTVGLPARGKTHISRALERYLRWAGVKTQVVSLGDYRRKIIGGAQKLPQDYFLPGTLAAYRGDKKRVSELMNAGEKSAETQALRKKILEGCEQTILDFFSNGGQVVIYDANNGTIEQRKRVAEKFDNKDGIHVIFLGGCSFVCSSIRERFILNFLKSLFAMTQRLLSVIYAVSKSRPLTYVLGFTILMIA